MKKNFNSFLFCIRHLNPIIPSNCKLIFAIGHSNHEYLKRVESGDGSNCLCSQDADLITVIEDLYYWSEEGKFELLRSESNESNTFLSE